jgi:hypothetical protein
MEQDVKLTLSLKSTWEQGYNELVVIDYSLCSDSHLKCSKKWLELCAYRRKVRLRKLNPIYTKEWDRISKTKLKRVGCTKITLQRCLSHFIEGKANSVKHKLPENSLGFPTSTVMIER